MSRPARNSSRSRVVINVLGSTVAFCTRVLRWRVTNATDRAVPCIIEALVALEAMLDSVTIDPSVAAKRPSHGAKVRIRKFGRTCHVVLSKRISEEHHLFNVFHDIVVIQVFDVLPSPLQVRVHNVKCSHSFLGLHHLSLQLVDI